MTTQVPEWLNLDKIVPPEMRAEIPEIAESARRVVDAVESFMLNAWPKYQAIAKQIDSPAGTEALGDWPQFIYDMTGLDEVEDCLMVAEWVLTTMCGGGTTDGHAHTIIMKRLQAGRQEVFDAFWQREHNRQEERVFGNLARLDEKIDGAVEEGSYDGS